MRSTGPTGVLETYELDAIVGGDEVHMAVLDLDGRVEGVAWKDDGTVRVATSRGIEDGDEVTVHEVPIP